MTLREPPLSGLVVVDLSSGIAGGYCTKVLADGGADVVKVEAPDGDPLRYWSASGAAIPSGSHGPLFEFLAAGKRSVAADPASAADRHRVHQMLEAADVVVWSAGTLADVESLHPAAIQSRHPHLTVTAISSFGLTGPWHDRPATEFTLQAWSGGVIGLGRGDPERAPTYVGGRIGEWLAGVYGAVGTMMSRQRGGAGELVDVSMLEVLCACLTYHPVTYFDAMSRPFRDRRAVTTPGVGIASDGMIAVGVGTGQQWLDFCVMVGHPEWMEDRKLFRQRGHLAPEIDAWFEQHTVAEIRELATSLRLPNAPVANGATLPQLDHFRARHSFVESPRGDFVMPGAPYRLSSAELRPLSPAPRLDEFDGSSLPPRRARSDVNQLAGLRVVDLTAFWAGPSCTQPLALLGAEVIHIESTTRPDGTRMLGVAMTEPQWWERSPIFAGINTAKKSLTLDLRTEQGLDVLRRLIASADVVVENFTPRVLDDLGLGFEALRALRHDIVLVRMPGFGLDGPWREQAAFAYTIEDASGLTWMTGYPGERPYEPYCVGDPNAGIHALSGLLLALQHRRRTGEAVLVEAAMVDAAINVTAEQVIEHSAHGVLLERAGNRGPTAAPQNLYRTADPDERGGNDSWVAIAVETDAQWQALVAALGNPDWAVATQLADVPGRRKSHDLIDEHLGAWCSERSTASIVEALWPAGVPVAAVTQPHRQGELEQLQARAFFAVVDHPVLGAARCATLPIRFSTLGAFDVSPAPLLGQHNSELLSALGYSAQQIADLESAGVIGRQPGGPAQ